MKIKYIGHSCFLVTTDSGTRIITDPYEPGCYDGAVKYRPVGQEADIVLVSHAHADHSHIASVSGNPRVVEESGAKTIDGIKILGVSTYHDTSEGSERGSNIIFRFEVDGLALCHLGDIGHTLDDATAHQLKPVDILMMPVGGFFTISSEEADALIDSLVKISNLTQALFTCPGFGNCPSPAGMNDAYGDTQLLVKSSRKEVGGSTKISGSF